MLFVSNNPVQVEILEDRKVIILAQNKIMFTQLDFIEEYLAMPLITLNPKKMYYQPSIMQALVVSETTLEVYYCDWKTQIKLVRVIILNNQSVEGISYDKEEGWQVYGSMHQYEPTRITFHKCKNTGSANILSQCFINKDKYVLTNDKLQKSERGKEMKEVLWKDRMMVIKNCNYEISMQGENTLDKKRDIICINSTYALIIYKFQVILTVMEPIIIYNHNNLLISNVQKDLYTAIKKYENHSFVQLGAINKRSGSLCGAFLYDNQLALLIYDSKQIHLTSLPLVQQQTQGDTSKKKVEGKKKLFETISRIMQQSHEDGSQLIQKDQKTTAKTDKIIQKDYQPLQKPIIRDIVVQDDQVRDHSLNEGTSEVLSRSGIDHTDRIVGDEGVQQSNNHQMSFQIQNGKDKKESFSPLSQTVKNKTHSTKFARRISSDNVRRQDSLGRKKKQKQSQKQQPSFQMQQASQLSEKSRSSIKNTSKSIKLKNNNKQAQNLSIHSNHSAQDHAQTPAFGFQNFSNDNKWGFFEKEWNQGEKDQINEESQQMEQSVCIDDQKSILKFMPEKLTKKVEVFKPANCILTTQLYNKIQKTSYCSLIEKAIEQDPDKIQEYLDMFLREVIIQPLSPLFFQKNIRTFNPQFTQDKIKKLFRSELNNQQLKPKMTQALQLFKISEVPQEVLCFPLDFIKVIRIIYKDVYIEDLLKPTQATVSYLLDSYFNIESFNQQIITIEDEQIDISHPRNMLNVLLYLNQFLGLKIDVIIKAYCTKIIEEDHLQILKKITLKENIFQICQVPRSVLDDVVIQRFNQLLNESVENAEYLWNLIEFLSKNLNDEYRIRLAIITQINKSNIIFNLEMFINIKNTENDIYNFLQKIIVENSCKNLSNLKFDSIYRSLYWLQEGQKISFVTFEYIELVKTLAEKFCEKKWFYHGLKLLDTIKPKIKLSLIVKLLFTYLNSKFINRLVDISEQFQSFEVIFPQLMSNPDIDPTVLLPDKIAIPEFSKSLSCSWAKFISIFDKHLTGSMEIKVLVFCEINIANQFFLLLDENQKRKFQKFLLQIEQSLMVQIDDINEIDESLNPKGITSLKFDMNPQNYEETQIATSTIGKQDVLIHEEEGSRKKIVYKSMTLIDHYNQIKSNKLTRRNSDQKNIDDMANNQDLMRIRLLVSKKQIIEELGEIYENKEQDTFIHSLQLVDHQKIKLYHTQVYKSIANRDIQYPISRILPFEVFLTPQIEDAFELTKQKIKSEVSILNFWIIYTIIELIFKKGSEVSKIFIQKCIMYYRSDKYNVVIEQIIKSTNPQLGIEFTNKILESALDYNLERISKTIRQYLKNIKAI